MTYGQLLRKLASLSEYQLKEEILLREQNTDHRFNLSHVTVWDDGRMNNESAEVNIFIELKERKLRL
jgi:hypothetical protein